MLKRDNVPCPSKCPFCARCRPGPFTRGQGHLPSPLEPPRPLCPLACSPRPTGKRRRHLHSNSDASSTLGAGPAFPAPSAALPDSPEEQAAGGPAARRDGLRLGAVTGTRPLRPLLPASNIRLPHRRQRRTSRPKGKCDPSHTRVERPSEDQLVMTLLCPTLHKPLHGTRRSLLHSCLVFTKLLERGHIQTTSAEHST